MDRPSDGPLLVGVAGGTGSGKTTVVREITAALEGEGRTVSVVHQDAYYRDFSHLSPDERDRLNFDHPDALEAGRLAEDLRRLAAGKPIDVPVYDFTLHLRTRESRRVEATDVILVDGILVLAEAQLRDLFDIRIFVDTDPDVRFIRRLRRDLAERGRTLDAVIRQYEETVRPMHLEFVEPSKRWADLVVPEGGRNRVAVETLVAAIRSRIRGARP